LSVEKIDVIHGDVPYLLVQSITSSSTYH